MTQACSTEHEYILGTGDDEIDRLRFQHQAWVRQAYELFQLARLREGNTVLDLGCGPGFTSIELAHVVGANGKVIARDKSSRFLNFLQAECARLGITQIETSLGEVEDLALPDDSLDAVYARWLFCWLADPLAVLRRVTKAVKPGGFIMLQEYLDWSAMKLVPKSDAFDGAVQACMKSWLVGDATIDICDHIPNLAQKCGLQIELFRPIARLGAVGSLEWCWVTGFLLNYLPKLIEKDLYTQEDYETFQTEISSRTSKGHSFLYTPTMADVILRKP